MQYRKSDHINSNKGKSYRDSPHLHCVDILLYSLHNLYHLDHCRSQGIQDGTLQQIRATITVQLHPVMVTDDVTLP